MIDYELMTTVGWCLKIIKILNGGGNSHIISACEVPNTECTSLKQTIVSFDNNKERKILSSLLINKPTHRDFKQ